MSPKEFTHRQLTEWGGAEVFNRALRLAQGGKILSAEWDHATQTATGKVLLPTGWAMDTGFTIKANGMVDTKCPCQENAGLKLICPHVVGIGLLLMCRMQDPEAEARHEAEKRRARRMAAIPAGAYVKRTRDGAPMTLVVEWGEDFHREWLLGAVRLKVCFADKARRRYRPEDLAGKAAVTVSKAAEALLDVLEDICEGPVRSEVELGRGDFLNVLELMNREQPVEAALRGEYDEASGEFRLGVRAKLGFEHDPAGVKYLVDGTRGFLWVRPVVEGAAGRGKFYPLARVAGDPFRDVYREPQTIPREMMAGFLRESVPVLRRQVEVELHPGEEMFRFVPGEPQFTLKLTGTGATLGAEVFATYGERACDTVKCGEPGKVSVPDPEDFLTYRHRNLEAEAAALAAVRAEGFWLEDGRLAISGTAKVLNFLGRGEPRLNRKGWRVRYSERLRAWTETLAWVTPTVKVKGAQGGAVDVAYSFEDTEGRAVREADVQLAINRGEAYIKTEAGTCLIDTDAVEQMRGVFSDCSTEGRAGSFRVGRRDVPFVERALGSLDAVEVDGKEAPGWREQAQARERDEGARYEAVDLGRLEGVLRPYQKQGVYWMRFLEKSGMSGLLADEMGLGKTLQTLTWISLERWDREARGKPALVVCPTSLVQNWAAEARKFTPWMKTLVVSGAERAGTFGEIEGADLVVTSYALLQRDLEEAYLGKKFGVVVLDEAQHIKNRGTRNAKSVKQLESVQKLVLTGTPVENSVADVWSIFDFLLPGYLGVYEKFNLGYQQPIEGGGEAGAAAQEKLHHKLSPFILRRLKKTVAKDLPDKIIKVAHCAMTEVQQRWYNKLLDDAKTRIGDLVKEKGFNRAKMEILAVLMRLRQVANDVELLKEYRERAGNPKLTGEELSGKLGTFFELLDEAVGGGHRVLVFSQFVGMLTVLRRELEARGMKYCYLDGATKNRLDECRKFNTDETIPVFLISLHAGGTGLTLTGADMVIHFDPWWNPAVEAQATDRAHRIGQKRTVYVVKMIAENTVEERVLELQQRKQLVIDATVGTTDAQMVQKLTYDDIKGIVGL